MCKVDLKEHIRETVQDILNESFTDVNRRNLRYKGSELLMACPICGDSSKDKTKKRAYFYFDTMKYHCFNGECIAKYWDAFRFFKAFGKKIGNPDYIKDIAQILKNNRTNRQHVTLQNSSEYFKFLFENSILIQKIKDFYGLKSYAYYEWSKQFIKDRLLESVKNDLLFRVNKWDKKEVWILNKIGDDKVVGLQIKNLDGGPKYLTKDFSRLHEEMKYDIDFKDEVFKGTCDNLSLIFNIFNVNLEMPLTVFEGPIDSFFLPNSVATAGATKLKEFFDDMDNIRYFYDNDKTGKTNAIDKIKINKPCFMWAKFFKDFKYKNKRIKDLNEMIKYVYDNREYSGSLNKLSTYFSKTKYDMYYV